MANIINLNAEIGANYIADDAQPAVTFQNTGTGPGLQVLGLVATSTASIDSAQLGNLLINSAATISGNSTVNPALTLNKTVFSGATIALVNMDITSTPSASAIKLLGQSFVSAVSIVFAASANWAGLGALRVAYPDNTTYGWIPILPSAVVTAAARA